MIEKRLGIALATTVLAGLGTTACESHTDSGPASFSHSQSANGDRTQQAPTTAHYAEQIETAAKAVDAQHLGVFIVSKFCQAGRLDHTENRLGASIASRNYHARTMGITAAYLRMWHSGQMSPLVVVPYHAGAAPNRTDYQIALAHLAHQICPNDVANIHTKPAS